mgnify:CR=1 FL=1
MIDVTLDKSEAEYRRYFNGSVLLIIGGWALLIGIIVCIGDVFWGVIIGGFGLALLVKGFKDKAACSDADIDKAWRDIAVAREDEAYKIANLEKEDTIRPAEWFYAFPNDVAQDREYKYKEGKDKRYRRNYQRLVYMIYGRDQLVIWDETINLETKWDSSDQVQEFFWNDVSAVKFDEKVNLMTINVSGAEEEITLTGDGGKDVSIEEYEKNAREISNGIRAILREKKSS